MSNVHHLRPLREVDPSEEERSEEHRRLERRDRQADHDPNFGKRIASGIEVINPDSKYRRLMIAELRLDMAEREVERAVDERNAARAAIFGDEAA